ncbi:lipase member H-A-like [Diorhabda carinulata]|uniref:lipase member H-A-like n=1 Tax=Diorhabda carinulata TaxID=1163345 RepID=UPI0025A24F95|nr:lipase member H-A-like [Diorhabda carinulata]
MCIRIFIYVTIVSQFCWCHVEDEDVKANYRKLPKVDFSVANANKDDILYTLFTNSEPTTGKKLREDNSNVEIIEKNITTVLIFHGWTTDDNSPWFRPLRDEFFKIGKHNIIFVNWSRAGNQSYSISCANVKLVGMYLAQFLIASKVDLDKVHLIGHSLGSQLTSYIGKSVISLADKKIGRITALDPAGPMWSRMLETERLNKNDADFVDVIHTDIQMYGFTAPCGDVDFYPNGGSHQPGCPSRQSDDNCSHARSTLYFIESLTTKVFAKEASFEEDETFEVTIRVKDDGKEVVFGRHVNTTMEGVYYLKTNSQKPFLNIEK